MKRERAKVTNDRRIQSDAELDELNRILDEGKPEHAERWVLPGKVVSRGQGGRCGGATPRKPGVACPVIKSGSRLTRLWSGGWARTACAAEGPGGRAMKW